MKYNQRYIARFTIEAETPVSVGSGEKGLLTDRLVAKDANGLPYIPGTSLTGVLRHSFDDVDFIKDIFGSDGKNGMGSRLIISSAYLVGEDGKTVIEGLKNIDLNTGYYSYFNRLPERDHVRMNGKGAADSENHGKYDEQLVHKGTRFVFEIELIGNAEDKGNWVKLLEAFASPIFRVGAGTRKGFGKFKIVENVSKFKVFNLAVSTELVDYLNKSSSLNERTDTWTPMNVKLNQSMPGWKCYQLELEAKNFFLFGAGFGDEDADNKPKTERFFDWSTGKPKLIDKDALLIPSTSIKGIIAHRVAYHYNKEKHIYIGTADKVALVTAFNEASTLKNVEDKFNIEQVSFPSDSSEWDALENEINALSIEDLKEWTDFKNNLEEEVVEKEAFESDAGENNEAVKALFGFAKNSEQKLDGLRGRVIINDIYLDYNTDNDKIFNHVKIDRFTSGTIDGALFQEKATQYKNKIDLNIWVDEQAFEGGEIIKVAFEKTLQDILTGNLQLGGNANKGHGAFKGTLKIN